MKSRVGQLVVAVALIAAPGWAPTRAAEVQLAAPGRLYATGNRPVAIAAAWLDGDTDTDIVIANQFSNSVSVFIAREPRIFDSATTYATGAEPTDVGIADMNGDQREDLVATNSGDNTVAVLLGNGDGTFQSALATPTTTGAIALAIGKFNGDPWPDVAVAGFVSGFVAVHLGRGDGTFHPRTDMASGSYPRDVVAADFDGDGDDDLAAVNFGSNDLWMRECAGNGTFVWHHGYSMGAGPHAIAAGLVNADYEVDLVIANRHSNTVTTLLGHPAGIYFTLPPTTPTAGGPETIALGDVHLDGFGDVVTGGANGVRVHSGVGDGTFQPPVAIEGTDGMQGVALVDLAITSIMDLVATQASGNMALVARGNNNGTFGTRIEVELPRPAHDVVTGDFDADGRTDLLVANSEDPKFGTNVASVYRGLPNGSYENWSEVHFFGIVAHLEKADLNNDGALDFVVVESLFGYWLSVWLGDGAGGFARVPNQDFSNFRLSSWELALVDLDGNGTEDLLLPLDGGLGVALGVGDGGFMPVAIQPPGIATAVAASDMDRDGHVDVATAVDGTSDGVAVYRGLGGGNLATAEFVPLDIRPGLVRLTDVTNDAALDIVAHSWIVGTPGLRILPGDGAGDFGPPRSVAGTRPSIGMEIADLDHDAFPEILLSEWSGALLVLCGDSAGSYSRLARMGPFGMPWGVDCSDIDGDGARDVLLATDDAVAILRNLLAVPTGASTFPAGASQAAEPFVYVPRHGPVRIHFQIAAGHETVGLRVYDVRGRRVWSSPTQRAVQGAHVVPWDRLSSAGEDVGRGVYFLEMRTPTIRSAVKFVLR